MTPSSAKARAHSLAAWCVYPPLASTNSSLLSPMTVARPVAFEIAIGRVPQASPTLIFTRVCPDS